ncbi:MAG: hypothetical protein IPO09_21105 [Anaeromyxobacter sp.]|nr:hypothetical protein [Anaeromyxobacter sp.]
MSRSSAGPRRLAQRGDPCPRPGERSGRVVAFEARMPYTLRTAARSGRLRTFPSGETLVAEYDGPGELRLQSRTLQALAGAHVPPHPRQHQGGGGHHL